MLSSYSAFAGNFPSVALDVFLALTPGPPSLQYVQDVRTVRYHELQLLHLHQGRFRIFSHGRHHCTHHLLFSMRPELQSNSSRLYRRNSSGSTTAAEGRPQSPISSKISTLSLKMTWQSSVTRAKSTSSASSRKN